MKNPWLGIPLSDYEGHMALPEVAQARLLADVFAGQLEIHKPRSLAMLGCAGGNGFERIAPEVTRRVVGVDLNGQYLNEVRARFGAKFERLELVEGDIQTDAVAFASVDLMYAALVLEYVNVEVTLGRMRDFLNPGGVLVTVVQLPGTDLPAVTPSPYSSLEALEAVMQFVAPKDLLVIAKSNGLRQISSATRKTQTGKPFQAQVFLRPIALRRIPRDNRG
ncbi:MAG: class I SAM-dependent methyltransferase [Betaproteobacteria bacterium]|nr:class I SAM-dependent methyltransferase [Betaproteobacteria bacterium]